MFKHVLIPTDGSELSMRAVRAGVELAKSLGAKMTFLTVTPSFRTLTLDAERLTDTPETYRGHAEERAARRLMAASDVAASAGVACDTVHREHDHPYEAILELARERGCDLIAMASHGRRGAAALMLGSETAKVLTHSSIPVLVLR